MQSKRYDFYAMDLSHLRPGEKGIITGLGQHSLTPKLAEMGMFRGKYIEVVFAAPFGGPIAVDIEGYVVSVRLEEARIVAVEKTS